MKLSIKNYKSCRGREGDAFSCTLYVDGQRVALVDYDGWGGEYRVFFPGYGVRRGPMYEDLMRYVATLPPEPAGWCEEDGTPAMYRPTLDLVLASVIDDHLARKYRR